MHKKYKLFLIGMLLIPVGALLATRWAWVKYFNLPKNLITKQQLADIEALGPLLQELGARVKKGDLPTRYVDLGTIGATEKESDLRDFRRFVQLYEVTVGKLPEQASDLVRLNSLGSFRPGVAAQIQSLAKQCSIQTLERDAYLLNCDGWRPSSPDASRTMVRDFDQRTERFYIISQHIFIYAPPSFRMTSSSLRCDQAGGRVGLIG